MARLNFSEKESASLAAIWTDSAAGSTPQSKRSPQVCVQFRDGVDMQSAPVQGLMKSYTEKGAGAKVDGQTVIFTFIPGNPIHAADHVAISFSKVLALPEFKLELIDPSAQEKVRQALIPAKAAGVDR